MNNHFSNKWLVRGYIKTIQIFIGLDFNIISNMFKSFCLAIVLKLSDNII